jgi:hypothetical protein
MRADNRGVVKMNILKPRKRAVFVVLFTVVAFVFTAAYLTQMRDSRSVWSSADTIKSRLLKQAPYGSSADKIKLMISSNGWPLTFDRSFEESETTRESFPGVKGTHAVGAYLGKHSDFPGSVSVDAFWGFDESQGLIDLKVRRFDSNAL